MVTCGSNQGHLYISLFFFFFFIMVVYFKFCNLININNIKKIDDECRSVHGQSLRISGGGCRAIR